MNWNHTFDTSNETSTGYNPIDALSAYQKFYILNMTLHINWMIV